MAESQARPSQAELLDEEVQMNLRLTSALFLSVCFLAALRSVAAQEPAAGNPKVPQSPHQSLATTANAPEEHLSLAAYFRELASQEQALAKSYDRIARIYEEKALPSGLDAAVAREMKNQLRRLAETEKKAAQAASNLAAYHARLAELVDHPPVVATKQVNPQGSAFRR
jgi:hypothetical protein